MNHILMENVTEISSYNYEHHCNSLCFLKSLILLHFNEQFCSNSFLGHISLYFPTTEIGFYDGVIKRLMLVRR